MAKCMVCGKEFKRLTATHLKTHDLTTQEYLKKYDNARYRINEEIAFLEEFYITVRYRFLEYTNEKAYTINTYDNKKHNDYVIEKTIKGLETTEEDIIKRVFPLAKADLEKHCDGRKNIGIYFPRQGPTMFSFDIDVKDTKILEALHDYLIQIGIQEENMLMSFSGGKGYHLDVFLDNVIDKDILNKLYYQALGHLKPLINKHLTKEKSKAEQIVEFRGGNQQALKLPFGYHWKTKSPCYVCNEFGEELEDYIERLKTKKKLGIDVICNALEINYEPVLNVSESLEYEELANEVNLLNIYDNTNEDRVIRTEQLLANGIAKGARNQDLINIGTYLKDIREFSLDEAIEFTQKWASEKCSNCYDKEFRQMIKDVYKTIYEKNYTFYVAANEIKISMLEIKEILSLTTNNALQTKSLRKLYFIMFIHAKAYARKNGHFEMTYDQMIMAGATTERKALYNQIRELEKLGKIFIVSANVRDKDSKTFKNKPNVYKLLVLKDVIIQVNSKRFVLCTRQDRCKECIDVITCKLLNDRDRAQYVKGKQYKDLKPILNQCEGSVI